MLMMIYIILHLITLTNGSKCYSVCGHI